MPSLSLGGGFVRGQRLAGVCLRERVRGLRQQETCVDAAGGPKQSKDLPCRTTHNKSKPYLVGRLPCERCAFQCATNLYSRQRKSVCHDCAFQQSMPRPASGACPTLGPCYHSRPACCPPNQPVVPPLPVVYCSPCNPAVLDVTRLPHQGASLCFHSHHALLCPLTACFAATPCCAFPILAPPSNFMLAS